MRSKLIWFINTLLDFIAIHVLHRQLLRFHAALKLSASLDEMISLHNSHLQKLENECLLQDNTAPLRQAILSILDMTVRFRGALIGDVSQALMTTQAPQRIRARLHRNRREQKVREGATGHALTPREVVLASDSESDPEEEEALDYGTLGPNNYRMWPISHDDQRLFGNIYEMQDELEKLVRFVHREVEDLVDSTSGAASAFSVLAFALEDWDR